MKYILFFILTLLPLCAEEKPLEKVSLQLQWFDQFQFAGYYMAKEKGFYKKAGFDFYSDILFTSQEQEKENPKRVDDFKNAQRGYCKARSNE